jgi:hypothetical protein
MGFYEKVKWVLGIIMVFILILATNLIDRNNFIRVKDSVSTIYEDRLIAYDIIFDMSKTLYEKKVAIISADWISYVENNKALNEGFAILLISFERTSLTALERKVFEDLERNFESLQQAEANFIHSNFLNQKELVNTIAEMKDNLHDLSEIQLVEGRRQVSISQNAVDTVELFTHLEIYILIFLAIIIQIIVMYKPKEKEE